MPGGAAHGAEAPHEAGGGHEAKDNIVSRSIEKAAKGSANFVKGTASFFWTRIKGVLGGVWDATGGQLTGEMKEIGKRVGHESHEEGPFNQIAGIVEGVAGKIGKVAGGIVDYTVSLPGRILGRLPRGAQKILNSLIGKESTSGGKNGKEEHVNGREAHGH